MIRNPSDFFFLETKVNLFSALSLLANIEYHKAISTQS